MNIPKPFTKKEQSKSQRRTSRSSIGSLNKEKSCVDMEELMQFEAARQRALAQTPPKITERSLSEFAAKRIFINHVDTFNGSHLVEHLCNMKSTSEEVGEAENDQEMEKLAGITDGEEEEEFSDLGERSISTLAGGKKVPPTYEILGSLEFYNNPKYSRPEGITELLDNEKKCEFLQKLFTCGFIIYDITSDLHCHPKQVEEAKWVLESIINCLEMMEKKLPKAFTKFKDCRVFILISTLLTWAKTKPIDPDTPNLPFTERDYRKRKPHPNYHVHCELEKRVIELGKKFPNHLKTIVIGSGIPYGYEEDILHFLFKMAWEDAPFLPIFSPGKNIIPVIHIKFFARIIESIIKNFPQKFRYIVASDPFEVKMKDIVKSLAKNLGNGRTKMVDKEEAFLYPDIKQRNYDMLTADINILPGYITDLLTELEASLPFVENISQLILEFKTARGLWPVKIFIHGPPGSGKTFLAKRLSTYYDIPHLHEKSLIEDTIKSLNQKIEDIIAKKEAEQQKANEEKVEIEGDEAADDDEEADESEEENLETLKEKLKELEDNMESNGNKLDEEHVLSLFKEKLLSSVCQNKGYVIDGYPETMEQTKTLYAYEGNDEEEGDDGDDNESQGGNVSLMCNMKIMPAYVESLDASDEFVISRMIKLPNINVTEFEESDMCRRLIEYRNVNTEDNTPLIFYDELDVHPMIYNVENDSHPNMEPTFQAIINHVGPPKNYGSATLDETEKQRECRKEQIEDLKTQADEVRKIAEERRQNIEKWMFLKNQELEMEEKALLVMGLPLRHYLMKYIFPCLTRGLVEVARLRPEDPVEFLSEFLFRENPEGKMFQPDYEKKEQQFLEAKKEYERMMEERLSRTSKSTKKSFSTEKSAASRAVSGVTNYKCSWVSSAKSSSSRGKTSKMSTKSSESQGIRSCQKSPSLSTCSSDRNPSSPVSCTCVTPDSCDTCETLEEEEKKVKDPCVCPCK